MPNLFSDISADLPQELTTLLAQSGSTRIERIVSTGQSSPEGFWYDQHEHEWVVVLKGHATLKFADGTQAHLAAGDYMLIPAHQKHRVEHTSAAEPTVWLAVFFS